MVLLYFFFFYLAFISFTTTNLIKVHCLIHSVTARTIFLRQSKIHLIWDISRNLVDAFPKQRFVPRESLMRWLYWFTFILSRYCFCAQFTHSVRVVHYILTHWGISIPGPHQCGPIYCDWSHSEHIKVLKDKAHEPNVHGLPTIVVAMYNIHSWWERTRTTKPVICDLKANYTMAETEESVVRYGQLFKESFKHFDGYSSTHPHSAVQRVYTEAFLNASGEFLKPNNFSYLIKAASYVASDCHKRDSANSNRDSVVQMLRWFDLRVDGLGRCMHQIGPEGVELPRTRDSRYNLYLKRETIGRFMFNLAFENSLEPGYVTEKPFDALIAGAFISFYLYCA